MDEGELRNRYSEIPWDQPVLVTIAGRSFFQLWTCRYCVALHGLKAQDVIQHRAPEFVYHSRTDALDHIENVHHD